MILDDDETENEFTSRHGGSLDFICTSRSINSNLVTVQQDETYSVYYISVGSSTCFVGCRHPSSGARTTVITASGID